MLGVGDVKLNKTSSVPSGASEEETDESKLECDEMTAESTE